MKNIILTILQSTILLISCKDILYKRNFCSVIYENIDEYSVKPELVN